MHEPPMLEDHEKMELILTERSDGSYGAPALQHAIHLDRKPFVALKFLFETMKIENLDYANAAIMKADTLVKNSKTFAHSNDPGDNQRGLRELHRAAEEQLTALKELSSAIEKLRKALED